MVVSSLHSPKFKAEYATEAREEKFAQKAAKFAKKINKLPPQ